MIRVSKASLFRYRAAGCFAHIEKNVERIEPGTQDSVRTFWLHMAEKWLHMAETEDMLDRQSA